jgi:group I intron endonuclease
MEKQGEMKNSGIYRILNISNGKIYIGSSINLTKRKSRHFKDLLYKRHKNKHLQSSYDKYGASNFCFQIIEYCDKKSLLQREQFYLDTLKPFNRNIGYNDQASATRKIFSYAHRRNIALSRLGKTTSERTKSRISRALKGRVVSTETRLKLRKLNIGKKLSKKHKEKLSKAHIGLKATKKHRENLSESIKNWWKRKKLL